MLLNRSRFALRRRTRPEHQWKAKDSFWNREGERRPPFIFARKSSIAMIIARTRFAGMNGLSLGRFVAKARRSIPIPGLVNVLVATSGEMKSLNARFRGKDETTDVLSFPTDGIDSLAGEIAIS